MQPEAHTAARTRPAAGLVTRSTKHSGRRHVPPKVPRSPREQCCTAGQRRGWRARRPVGRVLCTRVKPGRRPSIWDCRCRQPGAAYPRASDGPPSNARAGGGATGSASLLALLRVGFTEPPQSPAALVVSYTTVSPLPSRAGHRLVRDGGLFSVALSRGSPRVGVTDHPALRSPDLPHRASRGAAARPLLATARIRPPHPRRGRSPRLVWPPVPASSVDGQRNWHRGSVGFL